MSCKTIQRAVLCAAAVAALAGTLSPALAFADASQVGVNSAVRNAVQEKGAGEAGFHPAVVRAAVRLGDQVVSGQNSGLQVLLLDRSVFTVGANARMTIDRFVYDPNRKASDVAASVAAGTFRFMSGPSLAGRGRNVVNTPVATIGVRGTLFEGAVGADVTSILAGEPGLPAPSGDPAAGTLVVLRGPGSHTQGFDKVGAIDVTASGVTVVLDQPGQAALIWPGRPPVVFWISAAASGRLSSLLFGVSEGGHGQPGLIPGSVRVAGGEVPVITSPPPAVTATPSDIPPPTNKIPN